MYVTVVSVFIHLLLFQESSATTLTGSGDALLVDLLETQVESLKAKLEQTQVGYIFVVTVITSLLIEKV